MTVSFLSSENLLNESLLENSLLENTWFSIVCCWFELSNVFLCKTNDQFNFNYRNLRFTKCPH